MKKILFTILVLSLPITGFSQGFTGRLENREFVFKNYQGNICLDIQLYDDFNKVCRTLDVDNINFNFEFVNDSCTYMVAEQKQAPFNLINLIFINNKLVFEYAAIMGLGCRITFPSEYRNYFDIKNDSLTKLGQINKLNYEYPQSAKIGNIYQIDNHWNSFGTHLIFDGEFITYFKKLPKLNFLVCGGDTFEQFISPFEYIKGEAGCNELPQNDDFYKKFCECE